MSKEDIESLLDWTSKQGRILTANGLAEEYYIPDRGFPFREDELPHFHLLSNDNDTQTVFLSWARETKTEKVSSSSTTTATKEIAINKRKKREKYPVCGAWTRPLFVGGFEHSTNDDETVYNIQTNTLFIDMRIPRIAKKILPPAIGNVNQAPRSKEEQMTNVLFHHLTNEELRLYARRHAFAGYTVLDYEKCQNMSQDIEQIRPVCTRHHCIDWNFVGTGRTRPNKWFVEMDPNHTNTWKEWAYAKDKFDQHYYWERWERLENDSSGDGLVLALRAENKLEDCIIVAVGNHFNYIFSRTLKGMEKNYRKTSLVDLVDAAIEANDRETAESYLSIDAGHGTISSGWVIDCALQYWKEGTCLFSNKGDLIKTNGSSIGSSQVLWNEKKFDIYETSLSTVDDLNFILQYRGSESQHYHQQVEIERLNSILYGQHSKKRKLGIDKKT